MNVTVQQVILKAQMANVDFRIKCTTTFYSPKMCVRCSRYYGYLTWGYFDKPLKNRILQFCGFWLSLCVHTHTQPQLLPAACQAGMMYRTASLEASLENWSCQCWPLKWLTAGCSFAELQETLGMVLVVVMFGINRCVPWLQVLWLQMLNLHHCMFLVQDEACWGRRWVTAAAFLLRVDYLRAAIE